MTTTKRRHMTTNKNTSKFMLSFALASMLAFSANSHHRPYIPPHRPSIMHRMPPPPAHHRHHNGPIAPFAIGLGAGVFMSNALRPPIVVNSVWIPGHYEDRPILDAFGRVVSYQRIWIPGYWQN